MARKGMHYDAVFVIDVISSENLKWVSFRKRPMLGDRGVEDRHIEGPFHKKSPGLKTWRQYI